MKKFYRKTFVITFFLSMLSFAFSEGGLAGSWNQRSSGSTVRGDHTAVLSNESMFIFGGYGLSHQIYNEDLWEYNIQQDSWTLKSPAPEKRAGHSAVVYNNVMYVFGGSDETDTFHNTLWAYDIVADRWIAKSSGATARELHSAVLYNSKIYIFGGENSNGDFVNDLWEYDISSDSWDQKANAPVAIWHHSAVVYNNKMYIFGGINENIATFNSNKMFEYDFASNTWSSKGNAPFARVEHSATIHDEKMYVFGGGEFVPVPNSEPELVEFNDLWEYDFIQNQWNQITVNGTIPSPRACHSAIVYSDKMYVFSGLYEIDAGTHTNDLWEYDFTQSTDPTPNGGGGSGGGGGGCFLSAMSENCFLKILEKYFC